jgi:hypothetical protein
VGPKLKIELVGEDKFVNDLLGKEDISSPISSHDAITDSIVDKDIMTTDDKIVTHVAHEQQSTAFLFTAAAAIGSVGLFTIGIAKALVGIGAALLSPLLRFGLRLLTNLFRLMMRGMLRTALGRAAFNFGRNLRRGIQRALRRIKGRWNKFLNEFKQGKFMKSLRNIFKRVKGIRDGIIKKITESKPYKWVAKNIVTPVKGLVAAFVARTKEFIQKFYTDGLKAWAVNTYSKISMWLVKTVFDVRMYAIKVALGMKIRILRFIMNNLYLRSIASGFYFLGRTISFLAKGAMSLLKLSGTGINTLFRLAKGGISKLITGGIKSMKGIRVKIPLLQKAGNFIGRYGGSALGIVVETLFARNDFKKMGYSESQSNIFGTIVGVSSFVIGSTVAIVGTALLGTGVGTVPGILLYAAGAAIASWGTKKIITSNVDPKYGFFDEVSYMNKMLELQKKQIAQQSFLSMSGAYNLTADMLSSDNDVPFRQPGIIQRLFKGVLGISVNTEIDNVPQEITEEYAGQDEINELLEEIKEELGENVESYLYPSLMLINYIEKRKHPYLGHKLFVSNKKEEMQILSDELSATIKRMQEETPVINEGASGSRGGSLLTSASSSSGTPFFLQNTLASRINARNGVYNSPFRVVG